jgi:hypothetical protein
VIQITMMRLVGLLMAVVAIQTAWSRPFCTVRDVQGVYAFQADGTVLVPNTPITGPFMRLGWFNADGSGKVAASTLAVYNGINFGLEVYGGTYTVTSDCTIEFRLFIPAPINANAVFKGRVANDGEDVMFMLMSTENPQAPAITTVLGHGRRRKLRSCNLSNLNGAYRVEVNGWQSLPPLGAATPQRLLGRVHANGAGAFSASFIKSIGGIISEENTTGTYAVSSDCTFALSYTLGGAPTVLRGTLIDRGQEAFLALNPPGITVAIPPFGPVVINGVVATGTMLQEDSHDDRS